MPIDLKSIRQQLDLTQQALATRLGVSARTIARWESGGAMHWIYTLKLDGIIKEHQTAVEVVNGHETQAGTP